MSVETTSVVFKAAGEAFDSVLFRSGVCVRDLEDFE